MFSSNFSNIPIYFIALLTFNVLSACSSEGVYEAIRAKQKNDCLEMPPAQYEECMARQEKSYQEYKKQRDEIKK